MRCVDKECWTLSGESSGFRVKKNSCRLHPDSRIVHLLQVCVSCVVTATLLRESSETHKHSRTGHVRVVI